MCVDEVLCRMESTEEVCEPGMCAEGGICGRVIFTSTPFTPLALHFLENDKFTIYPTTNDMQRNNFFQIYIKSIVRNAHIFWNCHSFEKKN